MYLYFNAYLIKSVFFRCGIVKLNEKQLKDLKQTYENAIAQKMNLGATFLRAMLYFRRNTLGIGLIKQETIIAMLACKLCIRNVRAETRIGRLIKYNEQIKMIEYGEVEYGGKKERFSKTLQYGV